MRKLVHTREELLVLLIEECGEVIQAATKCLRFGWNKTYEGYGCNQFVLAAEVGDLLGVIDALPLADGYVEEYRKEKMMKAERALNEIAFEA